MNEVIKLQDIYVKFNGTSVLEGVTLSVKHGDFLGIIGPNGGGKTTLLKVILGLITPWKGDVRVLDSDPTAAFRHIGYVPQSSPFDRDFPISVFDAVLMGRLAHKKSFERYNSKDKEKTLDAIKTVDMLDLKDTLISRLSEGQKQRVFIARGLVSDPQILLLDEPTASIDSCIQEGLYSLLNSIRDKVTIILVSHDIGVISSYVNKIACLNQKLYFHDSRELNMHDLQAVYKCPVDVIAHGVPHRVMKEHD